MTKSRYLYLEGLRGVAACIVLLAHLKNSFWNDGDVKLISFLRERIPFEIVVRILHALFSFFIDGDLAVYIFWFMSGYVISIKLFGPNPKPYLIAAVSKRYFRLVIPVFGSVMIAYLLMVTGAMHNVALARVQGEAYVTGWLGNQVNFDPDLFTAIRSGIWDTFFDFRWFPNYNSALWTMNFELFGSLFCFFIFGIYGIHPKRYYAYGVLFGILFFMKSFWLCSFLAGFLLCDIDHIESPFLPMLSFFERRILSRGWLAAGAFILLLILGGLENYKGFSNVFVGGLLVFVVMRSRVLRLFFEVRPVLWLGRISFSLYLLHIPVLCSLGSYLYLIMDATHNVKAIVASVVTFMVTALVSWGYTLSVDDFSIRASGWIGNIFSDSK